MKTSPGIPRPSCSNASRRHFQKKEKRIQQQKKLDDMDWKVGFRSCNSFSEGPKTHVKTLEAAPEEKTLFAKRYGEKTRTFHQAIES